MHPPIRVGLCGYGYWGVAVARNLEDTPGLEIAAIAEPDLDRLGAAGRRRASEYVRPKSALPPPR